MQGNYNGSGSKLSFVQANAICHQFLGAGEAVPEYERALKLRGFSAWIPYRDFLESYCNSGDIQLHRLCLIEQAKLDLGIPWPMRLRAPASERVYSSPLLDRLRAERDRMNGVPVTEIGNRYPTEGWRREIDPCEWRRRRAQIENRRAYDERWNAMLEEQRRCFELEVSRHATGLSKSYTFDPEGRYEFLSAVLQREIAALGFEYDPTSSRPEFPVFSKPISADWCIGWAIEEQKAFLFGPLEGQYKPYLEIRHRHLRGSVDEGSWGEFLLIRYHHIVPGFGNAYWRFFDLDQLETAIKAHIFFYSLIAPVIEGGVQKVLGPADVRRA